MDCLGYEKGSQIDSTDPDPLEFHFCCRPISCRCLAASGYLAGRDSVRTPLKKNTKEHRWFLDLIHYFVYLPCVTM